ncbi:MAG: RluA family pseudouridine synthase [Desulfuromonadaceae bacterium]|nr:RluA family pseudouridine synthase [Desulfuromonadaceae bacterium]
MDDMTDAGMEGGVISPPIKKLWRLQPLPEEDGQRLDLFIAGRCPELSRGTVRKAIDLGGVHAGGRRVRRCSQSVRPGETVEVFFDGRPLEVFSIDDAMVVFRDPWLLAVNKPWGIDTNPTPARYKGTLYEALLRYLHNPFRPLDRPELGMVQRLDRDTSGLLIFSIHRRSHKPLTAIFQERRVKKLYRLLAAGTFPEGEGEFRSLLARNRGTNRMKSVAVGGREAITRYRVLERYAEATYVEAEILTGRSHQIRVHFSEAGRPLLGDPRYGGAESLSGIRFCRPMLHAFHLLLPHPVTDASLELTAPLPEDMTEAITWLRDGQQKTEG